MSWLFGDSLSGSNHKDPLGEAGAKFQKYTDPLAMIFGDGYVNLTSRKIPTEVNRSLSKISNPIDKVDQQINPMRPLTPGADAAGKWVSNKPGSTIGAVVGGMFAAPAMGSAMGLGGAGGASGAGGGALGAGEAAGGGMSALGYGGGVQSSVLPGIFGGGSVAPEMGGAGIFGGSAGTGSITGAGGMFGAGGTGLFGGSSGLSPMQAMQISQQFGNLASSMGSQPQQMNQQQNRSPAPQAILGPGPQSPTIRQQLLAEALSKYGQN